MKFPTFVRARASMLLILMGVTVNMHAAGFELNPVPIVIKSDSHTGPIEWAQDRIGAPGQNTSTSLQSIHGSGSGNAITNAVGPSLQLNAHALTQPSTLVVQGQVFCHAQTPQWTQHSTCQGPLPETPSGQSFTVTSTNGRTGTALYTCGANGNWSEPSAATCTATCGATSGGWSASAYCSSALSARTTGQVLAVASTNGNTGTAQFTCSSAGTWYLSSNGGCSTPTPPLGTLASDYFVFSSGADEGGSYVAAQNTATLGSLAAYAHSHFWDWYTIPYALNLSGGRFMVPHVVGGGSSTPSYIPSTTLYTRDGPIFYPANCTNQTRTVSSSSRGAFNLAGVVCRPGYSP